MSTKTNKRKHQLKKKHNQKTKAKTNKQKKIKIQNRNLKRKPPTEKSEANPDAREGCAVVQLPRSVSFFCVCL